jgi:cytochrome b
MVKAEKASCQYRNIATVSLAAVIVMKERSRRNILLDMLILVKG